MRPLILAFKETAQELKTLFQKEIEVAQVRDIEALSEIFPAKMAIYTKIESIAATIKKSFKEFSKEEQEFLKNLSQELDELGHENLLLLKSLLTSSQKMMDILIFASQNSQDSLKVYNKKANIGKSNLFTYSRGI